MYYTIFIERNGDDMNCENNKRKKGKKEKRWSSRREKERERKKLCCCFDKNFVSLLGKGAVFHSERQCARERETDRRGTYSLFWKRLQ